MVNAGQSFASGSDRSVVALAGLSSDELRNLSNEDINSVEFHENDLSTTNSYVYNLWTSMYKSIYEANAVMELQGERHKAPIDNNRNL
jgi:hypothetical protein